MSSASSFRASMDPSEIDQDAPAQIMPNDEDASQETARSVSPDEEPTGDGEDDLPETNDASQTKKTRVKQPAAALERPPGKSLLPMSRVQKIIKADKDIPIVAKDAVFLISLATEEFVKRIADASARVAGREGRVRLQQKDIATVVRKADEFAFLAELMDYVPPDPTTAKRKPRALEEREQASGALDQFLVRKPQTGEATTEEDHVPPSDFVMREDGTMLGGGDDEEHTLMDE